MITEIRLKITYLKFNWNIPGANELTNRAVETPILGVAVKFTSPSGPDYADYSWVTVKSTEYEFVEQTFPDGSEDKESTCMTNKVLSLHIFFDSLTPEEGIVFIAVQLVVKSKTV